MSTRAYIASLPREKLPQFETMAPDHFFNGQEYRQLELILELGKYTDYELDPEFKARHIIYFEDDIDALMEMSRESLLYLIDVYTKKNAKYFAEMTEHYQRITAVIGTSELKNAWSENKPFEKAVSLTAQDAFDLETALHAFRSSMSTKKRLWSNPELFKTIQADGSLVTMSWLYEYGIWNLVHILKTFDFDKNALIYYVR